MNRSIDMKFAKLGFSSKMINRNSNHEITVTGAYEGDYPEISVKLGKAIYDALTKIDEIYFTYIEGDEERPYEKRLFDEVWYDN